MFRALTQRVGCAVNTAVRSNIQRKALPVICVRAKHMPEADVDLDRKYIDYFNRADIDGWDLRQAMNDLQGMDLVPEPEVIVAALKACRRIDDYGMTTRYLEAVKDKCGPKVGEIWPYILQEIRPTLDELGISTPEELGFDKPELALKNVYDM